MNDRLRIALYQPDIAGNTGTILRFAACLGLGVDIIEPAGFPLSDKALKRAGMDYLEMAALTRHVDWHAFEDWRKAKRARLVLFVDQSRDRLHRLRLRRRRHPAVRPRIRRRAGSGPQAADARLTIPMQPGSARSINVALSVAMVAGEADPAARLDRSRRRRRPRRRRRSRASPSFSPRRTSPSPVICPINISSLQAQLNLRSSGKLEMAPVTELTVGQVAMRSGVAVSALHFYEARGLIRSHRTSGNQRRYGRDVLRRVAIIRVAQEVGISLAEIGAALESLPEGRTPTREDWNLLVNRLARQSRPARSAS